MHNTKPGTHEDLIKFVTFDNIMVGMFIGYDKKKCFIAQNVKYCQ